MSGPNLSQYFANDPPSMFDTLVTNSVNVTQNANTANDSINAFLSTATRITETNENIGDDIRDFWKPAIIEIGIPPLLTMPGIQTTIDLNDPIKEAVIYLLGDEEANNRKILTADDVTQDEHGIRKLIESGCLRSAVNLTTRCLTNFGQGYGRIGQPSKHTTHSLQLWFTRFSLLLKVGEFSLCQREAEAFGLLNRPDVYYEFYPELYGQRKGSMASFSFRLLLAKLPSYLGLMKSSLDRLTEMSIICNEIKEHFNHQQNQDAVVFWQKREQIVLCSLINCALAMKDFSLVDFLMEKLTAEPHSELSTRRALYSAWGRIYLQCGDVFGAEKKFSEARRIRDSREMDVDARDFIDKGLIAVAQNDFKEAYVFFQKAHESDIGNPLILNNMGVCLLYSGRLKEAVEVFERAIAANTKKSLNENILLNLCTLHELKSSNDDKKKTELLKKISRHPTDLNINIEYCLKLPTGNK